jgi:DNA-binding response OmpR family regulator
MTGKIKILIVEDEAPVAMIIRLLLGQAGCEAEIADTRARAMQMAQTGHFDLITLDVNVPGGNENGFDICRELKAIPHLRDTPIVFVSGKCSLEDQQSGLDAGAADYIVKPFDALEFATRILSHIKREYCSLSKAD